MRYEKRRNMVLSLTHCSIPNMMKVPPSMMKPAGNIAFTPHIDRYFPTNGPVNKRTVQSRVSMLSTADCGYYQT